MSGAAKAPPAEPRAWWDAHTDKAPRASDQWAASDRGWLRTPDGCLGHYLDYGPGHRRTSPDWCIGCKGEHARPGDSDYCATCQPGSIHAVSSVSSEGRGITFRGARYFVTVDEAQRWVEQQAGIAEPCPVGPVPKSRTARSAR